MIDDKENAGEIVALMRGDGVNADQFDIFWSQCFLYRFNWIENAASTEDILKEWPEFKKKRVPLCKYFFDYLALH